MKQRTDAERLEVIAPDEHTHAEEIIDLCAKVFSGFRDYYAMRTDVGYHVLEQGYDWRASRIGLLDGRIAAHWGVIGYTMRIAGARVRVGGVTCVVTHGEYRKRGLMPPTGRASIEAMRAAGYDVTMLFGIDDYYDRFGYVNAWAEQDWFVRTSDLPSERPRAALRRFSPRDMDGLKTLYDRAYARATGTAVRQRFPLPHGGAKWDQHLWLDGRRKPAGYVVTEARDARLTCHEQAGDVDGVLRALGQLARKAGCHHVRLLTLHGTGPLAARLRLMNCRVETSFRRCGGSMIAVLNLHTTLRKLTRELSRRLKRSPLADWRGRLLIADARDKATLVINRGDVHVAAPTRTKHAIRGDEALARLLIGSDGPDGVIDAAGIRPTGDGRALARVLFPDERPNLCNLDRY